MKAKDHYDKLLGNVYSWMVGDFEEKMEEQVKFFKENGLTAASKKIAIDLGAGHGLQTMALAKLGYSVKAVDFSRPLLNELANRKGDLDIELVEDELIHYIKVNPLQADVVVCMGDTLTHLETLDDVKKLVFEISRSLKPEGDLVFSFRDLTIELKQEQRFIAVKSDDSKILNCFLEYFPDHVMVHDILYEKENGKWIQKISTYPKLRLSEAIVARILQENNLKLTSSAVINRMIYLAAKKIA